MSVDTKSRMVETKEGQSHLPTKIRYVRSTSRLGPGAGALGEQPCTVWTNLTYGLTYWQCQARHDLPHGWSYAVCLVFSGSGPLET